MEQQSNETTTPQEVANLEGLGLAERRAIKAFSDQKLAGLLEPIKAAAGDRLEFSIDWQKIAGTGEAARYQADDYWVNVFFVPLAHAFQSLTADDLGKQTVTQKIKKIVLTYDEDTAPISNYSGGITLENGVLTLNFRPGVNPDDLEERTKAFISTLEPML